MAGQNTLYHFDRRRFDNSARFGPRFASRLSAPLSNRLAALRPPDLVASSDTGRLSSDNVTSVRTPTFSGKAPARLRFELLSGKRVLGGGRVSAKGVWTFKVPLAAALADGGHRFSVRTLNAAGKRSRPSPALAITIDGVAPALPVRPDLEASSDSGVSDSDNLTSVRTPTVSGSAEAGSQVELSSDGVLVGSTTAAGDGRWSITLPEAAALADGPHGLTARSIDRAGNRSPSSPELTITVQSDQPPPVPFSAALAASSDTGAIGDGITALSRISLTGQGKAGLRIVLRGTTQQTITGSDGQFQLPEVPLAGGTNVLVLDQLNASGEVVASRELLLTREFADDPDAPVDPVLAWNRMALEAIRSDAALPTNATRALAMQSIAVLDTLAAIDGTTAFLVGVDAPEGLAVGAAVAAASARVLAHLFPAQQAVFAERLETDLMIYAADPAGRTAAAAFGEAVADAVIALREQDGWDRIVLSSDSEEAGRWRPTPPAFELAQSPQWSGLTPFSLLGGDQFRPEAPPSLSGAGYAEALAEVQRLGSATSSERTADQTQIARFWADGLGSYTPPGHWNQIATELAAEEGYGYGSAARLLAMLNVALADASIAAWDSKYTYQLWRPITAIRNAEADGNSETTADTGWQPLLITPNHPEFVSGHSTYSAAAGVVLEALLGDQPFSTTSIGLPGVVRSYAGLDEAISEAGRSRIYGGIHYNFSNLAGQALGEDVATWVLDAFRTDVDLRGPQLVLEQIDGAVLQQAPTLSGFAIDNLSGVASLSVTLAGREPQLLSVDALGRFTLDVAALFGPLADGAYGLTIQSEDGAGNPGRTLQSSFQLDTRLPTVAITSFGEGGELIQGSRLSGVADGTGSALQSLSYRFNNDVLRPLAFDAESGAFDAPLNLASLLPGEQTLTITARDGAGFTTSTSIRLNLAESIPLAIEAITPADGSVDVGATFRPEVRFSRAVDPTTLSSDSFWAEDGAGRRLPATIVAAPEGNRAWLLFDKTMPGSATVTLRLNGGLIRASGDGQLLDADGDGTPGGSRSSSFTTVNLTAVSGTSLSGLVVSPGADLKPMTYDDFRAGPDGAAHTEDDIFLEPLAGVKVFILGLEDRAVYTDQEGRFELIDIPTGVVKVAIDGRTATNAPDGSFYPEMVMDVTIRPAQVNTIMGTMGSASQQQENLDRPEVYLPRISSTIFTTIAEDEPTVVTTPVEGAPNLTEEQRQRIQLVVQPNSVVGEDGQLLNNAQVGISTVPPELVRDMLPPGLLQHTFDLTIQAPGAAVFSTPLQLTLPNVFSAPPGTKLNLLSFDHTTGRLVIDGTGTVSEDGQFVVSDPDSGVTRPGWHGMTPPGSPTKGPKRNKDPKKDPKKDDCKPAGNDASTNTVNDLEFYTSRASELASCLKLIGPLKVLGVGLDIGQIMIDGIKAAAQLAKSVNDLSQAMQANQSVAAVKAAIEGMDALKDRFVSLYNSVVNTVNSNPVTEGVACARGIAGGLKSLCDKLNGTECANKSNGYDKICSALNAAEVLLGAAELALKKWKDGVSNLGVQATCLAVDAVKASLDEYVKAQTIDGILEPRLFASASSSLYDESSIDSQNSIFGEQVIARGSLGNQFSDPKENILQQLGNIAAMLSSLGIDTELLNKEIQDDVQKGELNSLSGQANTLSGELLADTVLMQSEVMDPPEGGFYYLFRIGNERIRGYSDGSGFEVFLGAGQEFELIAYDPIHTLVARFQGVTGQSGVFTEIPDLPFTAWVNEPLVLEDGTLITLKDYEDDDNDGVPNIAEEVVGTNRLIRDTDVDGIPDGIELRNNADPLGGFALPTGVVGSLALNRQAIGLALGSSDVTDELLLFAALGSAGVAVIDISTPLMPRLLAEIEVPGSANSLAYDDTTGQLTVATGSRLLVVDVSSPEEPALVHQLVISAQQVVADDGLAYALVGRKLQSYELLTGALLSSVSLPADAVGIAQENGFIYVQDAFRNLHIYESLGGGPDSLILRSSLTLPSDVPAYGVRKLYAADGILYVPAEDGFNGGYATIDVRVPSTPLLLSSPDDRSLAGDAIALTGSGLAVLVGDPGGVFGARAADLVRTTDPTVTGSLVTRITLPSTPNDVVFINGFAYVATASGLEVLNVVNRDVNGVAPSVEIDIASLDTDASIEGIQVQEGSQIPLRVVVEDDVLVSGVDVLVNGRVVRSNRSYPFDLRTSLPTIDENDEDSGSTVSIQIRVVDTAGNEGYSEEFSLELIPDNASPVLTGGSISAGAVIGRSMRAFTFQFSEPVQLSAPAGEVFQWFDSSGAPLEVTGVIARAGGRLLQLTFRDNQIPQVGLSRVLLASALIADLAGNPLGTESIEIQLEISPYDEILFGTEGDDPNLETGDGSDLIDGRAGFDVLRGNGGDDRLLGGLGYDRLYGGSGNDFLDLGGDGGDASGDAGDDELIALISAEDSTRSYYLDGGSGDDILRAIGGASDNSQYVYLEGGGGVDRLEGSEGQDNLDDDDVQFEDPVYNPANGHWYQLVNSYSEGYTSFDAAAARAAASRLSDWQGYLVTITSDEEQNFLNRAFRGYSVWLGGSDREREGEWVWLDGPSGEKGEIFFASEDGEQGGYSNWSNMQPYDFEGYHYIKTYLTSDDYYSDSGSWFAAESDSRNYILIEYGGMQSDVAGPLVPKGDVLLGGGGDDNIYSKGGNDEIDGGTGADYLDLDLSMHASDVTISIVDSTVKQVLPLGGSVVNIERATLRTGRGNDRLEGGSGVDSLYGGAGNDWLDLGANGGSASGEAGDDTLIASIGAEDSSSYFYLYGGRGDDSLRVIGGETTQPRNVTLDGGGGLDTLFGSEGNDSLRDGDESLEDAVFNEANGHWYQLLNYYADGYLSFDDALASAAGSKLSGFQGYLATITSVDEQEFLNQAFGGYSVWLGGVASPEDKVWRWLDGPADEQGEAFYQSGESELPAFSNWASGHPSNDYYPEYAYLQAYLGGDGSYGVSSYSYQGKWSSTTKGSRNYVLIEYGGMEGDPSGDIVPRGDVLLGRGGDDSIQSSGANDEIDGGAGMDYLNLDLSMVQADVSLSLADSAVKQLLPAGGSVVNVERGTIRSGSGRDLLVGGLGYNDLYGGAGNDLLDLGAGHGSASGEAGNDTLRAAIGSESYAHSYLLYGGSGDDVLTVSGGTPTQWQNVYLNGGGGLDQLIGSDGGDELTDNDELFEDPVFNPLNGHWYKLLSSYQDGYLSYAEASAKAADSRLSGLQGYLVTVTNSEEQDFLNRTFSGYNVWLGASDAAEQDVWRWLDGPVGEKGENFYSGAEGEEVSYANWSPGNPSGYSGYDYSYAYLSSDSYYSSNGSWTSVLASSRHYALIEYGGMEGDPVEPIEPKGDQLSGGAGDDILRSRGANDEIDGGDGADFLDLDLRMIDTDVMLSLAEPAVRQLLPSGGSLVNVERLRLQSGAGADLLIGGAMQDDLNGGEGDDLLDGGLARDYLTGGLGADTYRFSSLPADHSDADEVYGFSVDQGDRIQLLATAFPGIAPSGMLPAESFHLGSSPALPSHKVLYGSDGWLRYVSAGETPDVRAFARLDAGLPLTADQFSIV